MVKLAKMGRPITICAYLSMTLIVGCAPKPAATKSAAKPATVGGFKPPTEAELSAVTLTPEAETRLGIATATVERRAVVRAVTMGGDVMVPPGRSSIVSAPQTGTLTVAQGGVMPVPGLAVKKGQAVFNLVPILSADRSVLNQFERMTFDASKADAEGQADMAKAAFEIAKNNYEQAQKLFRTRDIGEVALQNSKSAYDSATATKDATQKRLDIFRKVMGVGAEDAGQLVPLTLKSPADGTLINVNVQVGQPVPAGSVLFEVANLDPVYVRVPVFVGEEASIDADKDATIGGLTDAPGTSTKTAKPARTTPSANPLTTTVDLYYEVENHDGKLRPGQRVGVTLPIKGEAESLVVAKAAIVRDSSGGAWVYETMGKHVFARRRVVVEYVTGPDAVLTLGPKVGTKVVTDGAAELFGAEFGGGK